MDLPATQQLQVRVRIGAYGLVGSGVFALIDSVMLDTMVPP